MKTTKVLLDEIGERSKSRFAERKEISEQSLSVRLDAQKANEAAGQRMMAIVTGEALGTAERSIHKVDGLINRFENLRLELIQIAVGERWHQTEHLPIAEDLIRDMGELAALLKVRETLARNGKVPEP